MSSNKKRSKEDSDDDHSNETFVEYGTELPDITTSGEQDKGKFQPVWKQEVRDEQGLRRFHGAFKGGWSAGYFNTVGSKEGWSPSTFVSSRKNRSDRKDFKPEDFMDDEDLEEVLQNQKLVATDEFDSFGSTERELEKKRMLASSMEASGSVLGALPDKFIDDLVLPNKDPVGVRLLKAMGWREGQGIGPRISKIQNDDSEFLESDMSTLFAPKDTEIINFDQKSNTYGLDFDSFKDAPEFIPQSSNIKGDSYLQRKKVQNSLSTRGTTNFADEDTMVMGGKNLSKYPNKSQGKKLSSDKLCHDGSSPLQGFVLASRPVPLDKWFAPPILPQGFVPIHELNSEAIEKKDTPDSFQKSKHQKQTTLAILAEQRGELLGETPLNAPARSVFDYVSRKDKNRLDNLIEYMIDTTGDVKKQPSELEIPKVDKDVAIAALQGFIPFENDKKKQARYKQFLEVQAELSATPLKQHEGFTIEQYIKELDEFAQSARIFRPMSKMMASRFTNAKSVDDAQLPEKDTRFASESSFKIHQDDANIQGPLESAGSSAEAAARMNMFGPLTRARTNFYPARLLCKRFNVANPHPDYQYDNQSGKTQKGQKDVLSKETMNDIIGKQDSQNFMEFTSSNYKSQVNIDDDKAGTLRSTDDVKEEVQKTRPAMELFKSIFGESDSGDEDEAPKHKGPPNMIVGAMKETNLIEDEKLSPAPSETIEAAATVPFRPMFKKKTDRSKKVLSNESTEGSQSQSIAPKGRKKGPVTRVTLSFDDDSTIGPSVKRKQTETKSSENDSSSSVESGEKNDSLSRREHNKHSHSRHKHSSSKKRKKKKKHSKGYDSSKKKDKKRSFEDSEDERIKSDKKKKRYGEEGGHDKSGKYHPNKNYHHEVTKPVVDKAKEDTDDKKFEAHSERLIESIIDKREEPTYLTKSKEKQITSPRPRNDNKMTNTSSRPRAMDLW
ncbi:1610_t:CDS:10 [Funneliformis caledonium]|uniref:1610_t:CDS:1 n=1 Tax=Funneliformis caledonium TaxID=1117310 RepID=A0A9N8UYY7_9GLOM|nr:1610_t:CDS:10 [Funneliformis caledonium]